MWAAVGVWECSVGGSNVVRALEGTVTSNVMSAGSSWAGQVESKGEALTK